jgi:hypothetical protein
MAKTDPVPPNHKCIHVDIVAFKVTDIKTLSGELSWWSLKKNVKDEDAAPDRIKKSVYVELTMLQAEAFVSTEHNKALKLVKGTASVHPYNGFLNDDVESSTWNGRLDRSGHVIDDQQKTKARVAGPSWFAAEHAARMKLLIE